MKYETDNWLRVPARWFTKFGAGRRAVRVVVIHVMEAPEGPNTAENVAKYFATTDTKASAHVCVDQNSIVQCVLDNDIAFAAPGCNHDGIQIELAGFINQSGAEWLDDSSILTLARGADVCAQYLLKYDLPDQHIRDSDLDRGFRGIVGHDQVSRVYKKSDHTDPGPNFPWEVFLALVRASMKRRRLTA